MSDTTMGAGGAPKVDPESLVLRASPRRVTRFKRHVVIGVVSALVIGVYSCWPHGLRSELRLWQSQPPVGSFTISIASPRPMVSRRCHPPMTRCDRRSSKSGASG